MPHGFISEAESCGGCTAYDSSPINDTFPVDGALRRAATGERWISLPIDPAAAIIDGRLQVGYTDVSGILGDLFGLDFEALGITLSVGGAGFRWQCRCGSVAYYVQTDAARSPGPDAIGIMGWVSTTRHIHEGELLGVTWRTDQPSDIVYFIQTGVPPTSGPRIAAFQNVTGAPQPSNGDTCRLEIENGTASFYVNGTLYGWEDVNPATVDLTSFEYVGVLSFDQNTGDGLGDTTYGAFGAGCL